jgi:hypothetical protein
MRTMLFAAVAFGLATSAFAAPQSHGAGAGGAMSRDSHGDAVSTMAAQSRASDTRVGPAVSDVAQDKAKGKGKGLTDTTTTHGKTHMKTHGKH